MINIFLIIYGYIFMLFLATVYFSKKRFKTKENNVYSLSIITTLVGAVLEIISSIAYFENSLINFPLFHIITRLIFIYYVIWCSLLLLYYLYVIINNEEKHKLYTKIIGILGFVSVILLSILPYNYVIGGDNIYPEGPAVILVYSIVSVILLTMIIIHILNKKKVDSKKIVPFLTLISLGSIAIMIQAYYPSVFLTTPLIICVTFLMYFTIENPDVKMLEEYHRAKEIAENSNNEKAMFLLNVSQEIKTPANNINILVNELKENIDKTTKAKILDYAKVINDQSNENLSTVNNALDISTMEIHDIKLVKTKYSPKMLFKQVVAMTKENIDGKLEFHVSIDESIPDFLYGDSIRIKEIFRTILNNSIKHTENGYISLTIKNVVKDNLCRLMITIEDSGIGIDSKILKNIFDKEISKRKELDKEEQTLARIKSLILLIGGTITVSSTIGNGTKFTIILDQKTTEDDEILKKLDDKYMHNKKVLVVDFDKNNVKNIKKYLKKYECIIDDVDTSVECLEKIRNKEKYDLIFIREDMPKLTGDDIIFKLKEIKGFNIPIVMIIKTNRNTKYDEYVVYPIKKDLLHAVVDDYLK